MSSKLASSMKVLTRIATVRADMKAGQWSPKHLSLLVILSGGAATAAPESKDPIVFGGEDEPLRYFHDEY
ncbi:MAG: hypothetical protein DMG81_05730 [Acidobacteria bacterium]|nr:MAG: hypothetical protein DMG81_05730 [Acidobacteriota bacterium]